MKTIQAEAQAIARDGEVLAAFGGLVTKPTGKEAVAINFEVVETSRLDVPAIQVYVSAPRWPGSPAELVRMVVFSDLVTTDYEQYSREWKKSHLFTAGCQIDRAELKKRLVQTGKDFSGKGKGLMAILKDVAAMAGKVLKIEGKVLEAVANPGPFIADQVNKGLGRGLASVGAGAREGVADSSRGSGAGLAD
jgi:hypothetical protein